MKILIDRDIYDDAVLEGLLQATTSLRLATATLKNFRIARRRGTRGRSLARVLSDLSDRGVDVRLLHAGVPSGDFRRELKELEPDAFGMKRCVRVHFKAIIVDARTMVTGSANLTGAGVGLKSPTRRNFEVAVSTRDADAVDRVSDLFDAIWDGRMCDSCDRRKECIVPLESPWSD